MGVPENFVNDADFIWNIDLIVECCPLSPRANNHEKGGNSYKEVEDILFKNERIERVSFIFMGNLKNT